MDDSAVLPAQGSSYEEVAIDWQLEENAYFVLEGDQVIAVGMPYIENEYVLLTATLTCGEAADTKDFTLTILSEISDPNPNLNVFIASSLRPRELTLLPKAAEKYIIFSVAA